MGGWRPMRGEKIGDALLGVGQLLFIGAMTWWLWAVPFVYPLVVWPLVVMLIAGLIGAITIGVVTLGRFVAARGSARGE